MGSFSKFGQAVPEIFVFQKRRFLWTRVKGKLHIGVALKTVFDGFFFCSSRDINPHNFVKNHSICKNKDLFYAKFY